MKLFSCFTKKQKSQIKTNLDKSLDYPTSIPYEISKTNSKSFEFSDRAIPKHNFNKLDCFKNNQKINENFNILERIAYGTLGDIYKVRCKVTNQLLAIKVEKFQPKRKRLLSIESVILSELQNKKGFAKLHSFIRGEWYDYLIMGFLGSDLESLRKKTKGFSLKTVLMIGHEILERLEDLHSKNYIHRDIKPENFLIGLKEDRKTIYMIDFGCSKSYINENNCHINCSTNKQIVGTPTFVSLNTHVGLEQSRRDDIESLGYMLIYFYKGYLPWGNYSSKDRDEINNQIFIKKQEESLEKLCLNMPKEFYEFMKYARTLKFESTPDYSYLKQLLLNRMRENDYIYDYEFDWNKNLSQSFSRDFEKFSPVIKEKALSIFSPQLRIDVDPFTFNDVIEEGKIQNLK